MSFKPNRQEEAWRTRLSRRLTVVTIGLTAVVFVPLILVTTDDRARTAFIATALVILPSLVWLWRGNVSERTRSLGVIATFFAVGTVGYASIGFQSGPGVGFATALAFAGLLLGRRAMLTTIVIAAVAVAVIATLTVHGVIPAPTSLTVDTTMAKPWIRSTLVTLILILILGAAVTGVVETIEDAMQRAESEGERRREAELQVLQAQSTELIGQLAASLAHDVNNQLTVIASWSDLITADSPEADRQTASAAVSDSVDEASALTRQLLMLGRRDAPVESDIDIAALFDRNRQMLNSLAVGPIDLDVHAEPDIYCRVDRSQLGRVLLNLAMNARDAMPDGGLLTIRAERRRGGSGLGVHGLIPRGDWIVILVEDTGIGMDAETQRRAFEPFFTTKRIGYGSGLGLTTITVFAEQTGGHVTLDTEPGRGTRIELWLPAVDGQPHDAPEQPAGATRLDGVRVLVVDDEYRVLDVARRALAKAGASVTTSRDGTAALKAAGDGSFDVLCTDVVMPGPPVTSLITAFRAGNPDGKLLLCSGYVAEELVQHGIEDGRYEVLPKPYRPENLVAAIAGLRSGASGHDQSV